jgi:hypothetical protein
VRVGGEEKGRREEEGREEICKKVGYLWLGKLQS